MTTRVNDLGIRRDQMNQSDVGKIVRHLVDKERRASTLDARTSDVLLTELLHLRRPELVQNRRIARWVLRFPLTAEASGDFNDVRKLCGAIDLAMAG